jgi:hypothetical protein
MSITDQQTNVSSSHSQTSSRLTEVVTHRGGGGGGYNRTGACGDHVGGSQRNQYPEELGLHGLCSDGGLATDTRL